MKKREFIYIISWVIEVLFMFFIIVLPKNENKLDNLYMVFLVGLFVVPVLLIMFQMYDVAKGKADGKFLFIPAAGCSGLISLVVVNFIASVKNHVKAQMIFIMITFILLEILIGYLLYDIKTKSRKKYLLLVSAIYIALILFFFCAMIMSYDHSIIW